jgi:hypothetical protein
MSNATTICRDLRAGQLQADDSATTSFVAMLNAYYKRWSHGSNPLQRKWQPSTEFAEKINRHLSGLNVVGHDLDADRVKQMMKGEILPTPEQLMAICIEFKLYGDSRATLQAFAAAEQQARIEAKERDIQQRILPLRASNPAGDLSLPSFAEMVEESYRAKCAGKSDETIVSLLWERVFKAWKRDGSDMSPEQFCALIETNNANSDGKARLTNTSIYNWRKHPDKFKPIAETVEVICRAFGMLPKAETPEAEDHTYELMLWKIIDGRQFSNPYPPLAVATEDKGENIPDAKPVAAGGLSEAIVAAKAAGNHGLLVREMIDASGISLSRLQTLLECQQIHQWCKGAHFEDVATARKFIALTCPDARDNKALLGLLTGRIFDLPVIIEEAAKQPMMRKDGSDELVVDAAADAEINHGGKLLVLLTGRKGLVTISAKDLADAMSAKGHKVSEEKVKKMRASSFERGGRITEPMARSIVEIVQEKASMKLGEGEIEQCVDILTNCPTPSALLARCVKGEMKIGELLRQTYERKGMRLEDLQSEVKLAHLTNFLLGKADLDHESATKLVNWFVFEGDDRRKFMVLATGHDASIDPSAVLDRVRSGTLAQTEGLRLIYDASGMTRTELAKACGVDIAYSVTEKSKGRIMAAPENMRKLADLCGLGARLQDFTETFSGRWAARATQTSAPDKMLELN